MKPLLQYKPGEARQLAKISLFGDEREIRVFVAGKELERLLEISTGRRLRFIKKELKSLQI